VAGPQARVRRGELASVISERRNRPAAAGR
jgi:hypothetical protein